MWKVDPKDSVPVYEQIANQLKYQVARGRFGVGDKLPSVRGLARETLVNPNTIVRVYRNLEHEGVVRSESGRGMFVADEALALCRRATREVVTRRIEQALDEAERAGLPLEEIEAAVRAALDARREALRARDGPAAAATAPPNPTNAERTPSP